MTRQLTRQKEGSAARSNSVIEDSRQALFDLSKDIHSHPELNYQERYSSSALTGFLESRDIQVERGVGGLETAFRATIPGGGEGPTIAVLAEYDALPEIGHGCGHNLIAMAAMGAALDAIDRKIDLHRRKRAVLEELFKALLHKLMTGEIRVGELDVESVAGYSFE